ncbi:MAG TPA: glycosyltransferase family 39 protein [Verrucomicrobiae bacterium]|nr:glycosyltransferase family 39 protein [Verrucomicrobiae bacterium]
MKTSDRRPVFTALFLFLAAFAARLLFYPAFRQMNPAWSFQNLDVNHWLVIARNVAAGRGFTDSALMTYFQTPSLHATAARSPVPVLLLAGLLKIFPDRLPTFLIYSWTLSGLNAAALYYLALRRLKSRRLALVTGLIYCFYFPEMDRSIAYAAASEGVFILLFIAYFRFCNRCFDRPSKAYAAAAGLVFALAFLSRPVILFMPALFAGAMIKHHRARALAPLACFAAAAALCAAPWTMRNQKVFGRPVLTTTLGGYNLLRHNWMIETGKYKLCTDDDFEPVAHRAAAETGRPLESMNEAELDALFKEKAKQIIRRYPLRYLEASMIRLFWLWYKIGADRPLYVIQNAVIYAFLLPGLVMTLLRRSRLGFISVHFLYFIVMHAAINAQFRFIEPLMGFGIMIAVFAAADIFGFPRNSSPPPVPGVK